MGLRLRADGSVYLLAALAIFLVPLRFLLGAVLAAAFHELCHALAIYLSGGKILGITLHAGGAEMETAPMPVGREVLCALAGPGGSFLLLTLAHLAPEMALCAAVQGAFNLLPIYPLDGGRAVEGICRLLFGENGAMAAAWVQGAAIGLILLIASKFGLWPMIFVLLALARGLWKKNPLQSRKTRGTIDLPFKKR